MTVPYDPTWWQEINRRIAQTPAWLSEAELDREGAVAEAARQWAQQRRQRQRRRRQFAQRVGMALAWLAKHEPAALQQVLEALR